MLSAVGISLTMFFLLFAPLSVVLILAILLYLSVAIMLALVTGVLISPLQQVLLFHCCNKVPDEKCCGTIKIYHGIIAMYFDACLFNKRPLTRVHKVTKNRIQGFKCSVLFCYEIS